VGAVSLDAQGIARIVAVEPDVVLVDVGQSDAVATARRLRSASPQTKLVAFALDEIDTDVFACAAAGFSSLTSAFTGSNT
jgi:DNA-binding NarL/FixJ family response regulator